MQVQETQHSRSLSQHKVPPRPTQSGPAVDSFQQHHSVSTQVPTRAAQQLCPRPRAAALQRLPELTTSWPELMTNVLPHWAASPRPHPLPSRMMPCCVRRRLPPPPPPPLLLLLAILLLLVMRNSS